MPIRNTVFLAITLTATALLGPRPAMSASPAGDVVGVVSVGYQGWFSTPTDGSGLGWWWHFSTNNLQPNNSNSVIHAWPDMREFTNQYQTGYANLGDGQIADLFTSYDQQVVNTHFSWMAQNGIRTAALQRFGTDLTGSTLTFRDHVSTLVMNAAQSNAVKFYVMYDSSGWTNFTQIESDWTNDIVGSLKLTSSSAYAHQNGKPVVCIWGPGFNDGNHPGTAAQWLAIIQWFQGQGCYVIGGTPTHWLAGNSDSQAGFLGTYTAYNMISPWMVGQIGTIADENAFRTSTTNADVAYCVAHGIDYQPCILPGDTGQRLHGTFMWDQFANEIQAGANGLYISMFDEFNEGNQIAKTAEDSAMSPVGGTFGSSTPFFTLDQDGVHCSSDFYLRETGDGGKMLKGTIGYTTTCPTPVVLTPAAPTGLTVTAGSGQATLRWTACDETSSYNVYRSTTAGGEGATPIVTGIAATPSGTVPRPTITYTNTGLTNGVTYYYLVSAVNPTGTSARSNETSVKIGGGGTSEGPYGGSPAPIPGTIQAENYDTGGQGVGYNVTSTNGTANSYRSDGVDLETTTDTGGGYDVGWSAAGQWFRYTVNVATAGTYTISLRVAANAAVTNGLHISNSSGTNLSGEVSLPSTGGWQTWETVTASVTLPAGQQVLTVNQDTGGWNFNYMTFATSGGGGGNYNGTWQLTPENATGLRLDVAGNGTANGTLLEAYTSNGTTAQTFAFSNVGVVPAGDYNFVKAGGSYCVQAAGTTSGSQVEIWACAGTAAQAWNITADSSPSGYFQLAPSSSTSLRLDNTGTASGSAVEVVTSNSSSAQQWSGL